MISIVEAIVGFLDRVNGSGSLRTFGRFQAYRNNKIKQTDNTHQDLQET